MSKKTIAIVAVNRVRRLEEVKDSPLSSIPNLTVFLSPNIHGPITEEMRALFAPGVKFGMFGWEGVPFELSTWASNHAQFYINKALEMGYDPIFFAPDYEWDEEFEDALRTLKQFGRHITLLHREEDDPQAEGIRLYPGFKAGREFVDDHIFIMTTPSQWKDHPRFKRITQLQKLNEIEFCTPEDYSIEQGEAVQ